MQGTRMRVAVSLAIVVALALGASGCTVQTDKSKDGKNVNISTMFGDLKVNADDKNPPDTGMTVYPGAKLKPKQGDGDHEDTNAANVNINSPFFGVKVAAATYLTDASREKIADYYRNDLKKYGAVIECKNGEISERKDSQELYCREGKNRDEFQLGVGSKERRHIVAIKPAKDGNGTEFSLVYVQVRGKEGGV